ncbi:MAG: LysR family transcriptional regulator [Marinovum sp.]|nr:LysR family transcriptional regulator [Marinovum sp.]
MDSRFDSLDWSLVASFLAVADEGSLSGAARALGMTQPTLGRQIKQLEEAVGFALFDRQPRGLRLTEQGKALVPAAQEMRRAAKALELAVAGYGDQMAGTVRITASVFTAHYLLPKAIAKLRLDHPEIQLEIVPTDSSENLLFREADIALRMYRTEQLEIITRKIGDLQLGIFAATSYLDRVGRPETVEALFALDFIGYDRSELILRGMKQAGFPVPRDWFPVRCDSHPVYMEMMRAGCGLGFAQINVALRDPDVEQVFPEFDIAPLPLWIAAHESVRRSPRVSAVWDALLSGLRPYVT